MEVSGKAPEQPLGALVLLSNSKLQTFYPTRVTCELANHLVAVSKYGGYPPFGADLSINRCQKMASEPVGAALCTDH